MISIGGPRPVSQPPPADFEQSLDGLLAGLGRLLASRDRLASPKSIPVDHHAAGEAPSQADWEFLGLVASVGWVALSPERVAGTAQGARALLRRHLRGRAATFALANGRSHLLSPRWARLMGNLGEDQSVDQADDAEGLLITSATSVSPTKLLHDLATLAGPVGETLTVTPTAQGQAVYLPSLPELGLATQAARGALSDAVHWSSHEGEPCLFFWLDDDLNQEPAILGMGLLGSGETRLVLRRP